MPASPGAVQRCARGRGVGAGYRQYQCRRCGRAVWVCRPCDRGQAYCLRGCRDLNRGDQLRQAAARYQRSRRGARSHAARQRRYREHQRRERQAATKIVTHLTSARSSGGGTVMANPITRVSESADDPERSNPTAPKACAGASALPQVLRCEFCQRPLGGPGPGVSGGGSGAASASAALRAAAQAPSARRAGVTRLARRDRPTDSGRRGRRSRAALCSSTATSACAP